MSLATQVEACLPYLRRYARAATGSTTSGDTCVELALRTLLEQTSGKSPTAKEITRADLFKLVDIHLDDIAYSGDTKARRALLLVAMEGLTHEEAATILAIDEGDLNRLLAEAQKLFQEKTASAILIIEDEALIAAQLKRMAEEAGHKVIGIATRASEAITLGQRFRPDLVLCDIHLADGSLGTEAIAALDLPEDVPVIYITAYPEKYLSTANQGPSYLVTKPFKPDYVTAIMGHALLNDVIEIA